MPDFFLRGHLSVAEESELDARRKYPCDYADTDDVDDDDDEAEDLTLVWEFDD